LAGYDFKIVDRPGNLNGNIDALSRRSKYHPEKGDRGENDLQPRLLVLKPQYFNVEITLEGNDIRILVSGSKLHPVPPIKFIIYLMEYVVMGVTEVQE
jgi:hypothetical protein